MNKKKVYIIKGAVIDKGERKEWVEGMTISRTRAEKIKMSLNESLISSIEKGRTVFDLYLKDKEENKPWEDMEFDTERMNEKEFIDFCSYRYGTKLPFKIDEMDLI